LVWLHLSQHAGKLAANSMQAFLMRFLFGVKLAAAVSVGLWLSATESGPGQAADLEQILRNGHVPGLSHGLAGARRELASDHDERWRKLDSSSSFMEAKV
jgi:hypothetical protein